jgi:predicted nuclease of restriction endonuclease-like (RecB) superfamily
MTRDLDHNLTIVSDIKTLIVESKQQVMIAVNSTITMLYWNIGNRINTEILQNQRAEYGKQIVSAVSRQLEVDYGGSFSEKNLRRMVQFATVFPEKEIVVSLIRQLSWTHILAILPIDDIIKRQFYIEICKIEKWSVRTFREKINSMLYERTAISKKPEDTIKNELKQLNETNQLSPDFAFLARQKRLLIDHKDYYIDLLFYHRRLQCLVAIDLKIGEFDASYKGEMELYLAYLEKHESIEGENPPIGLILCTGKRPEHIELLQLHKSNIKVADYFTILPSKEILLDRLNKAIAIAQNQLNDNK